MRVTVLMLAAGPQAMAAPSGIAAGDLAFIGFNADGTDDLAVVTLINLRDETLFLTDDEADGAGGKTTGEGVWRWDTGPDLIPAGTVVTFGGLAASAAVASHGTLSEVDLGFNLAAAGDGVLLYTGADFGTPTTFVAGIENLTDAAGPLTGTGLTRGTSFLNFSLGAHDDGGAYVGPRTGLPNLANYVWPIHDPANWDTDASEGTLLLPFDTARFVAAVAVPTLPPAGLAALALSLGLAGASASRRRAPGA